MVRMVSISAVFCLFCTTALEGAAEATSPAEAKRKETVKKRPKNMV